MFLPVHCWLWFPFVFQPLFGLNYLKYSPIRFACLQCLLGSIQSSTGAGFHGTCIYSLLCSFPNESCCLSTCLYLAMGSDVWFYPWKWVNHSLAHGCLCDSKQTHSSLPEQKCICSRGEHRSICISYEPQLKVVQVDASEWMCCFQKSLRADSITDWSCTSLTPKL